MLLDQIGESAHPGVIRHSDGQRYSSGGGAQKPPRPHRRGLAVAIAITALTVANSAHAEEEPLVDDDVVRAVAAQILANLSLHMQAQLSLVRAARLPDGRLGLIEAAGNVSLFGFGVAAAAGFERIPRDPASAHGAWRGGYGHVAAQWRPVALSSARIGPRRAYEWLDPFVALGVRLGGVSDDIETRLRAAMTLGAGLDVAWAAHDVHPMLTLRYRVDLLNAPIRDDQRDHTLGTPEHFLSFGVGIRVAE